MPAQEDASGPVRFGPVSGELNTTYDYFWRIVKREHVVQFGTRQYGEHKLSFTVDTLGVENDNVRVTAHSNLGPYEILSMSIYDDAPDLTQPWVAMLSLDWKQVAPSRLWVRLQSVGMGYQPHPLLSARGYFDNAYLSISTLYPELKRQDSWREPTPYVEGKISDARSEQEPPVSDAPPAWLGPSDEDVLSVRQISRRLNEMERGRATYWNTIFEWFNHFERIEGHCSNLRLLADITGYSRTQVQRQFEKWQKGTNGENFTIDDAEW